MATLGHRICIWKSAAKLYMLHFSSLYAIRACCMSRELQARRQRGVRADVAGWGAQERNPGLDRESPRLWGRQAASADWRGRLSGGVSGVWVQQFHIILVHHMSVNGNIKAVSEPSAKETARKMWWPQFGYTADWTWRTWPVGDVHPLGSSRPTRCHGNCFLF